MGFPPAMGHFSTSAVPLAGTAQAWDSARPCCFGRKLSWRFLIHPITGASELGPCFLQATVSEKHWYVWK